MIPQISQAPGVVQLVLNFLQELEQQGFTGDTATSYADRLTMSTDNSIYQLLPDAVVFPRSTADVALIARLAAQERYSSLIFTPRGGGTGTNGQALNQGIIVDMSRHMNRIIEINPEEGWVRVEAGVIKDQLNQYLITNNSVITRTARERRPNMIFCKRNNTGQVAITTVPAHAKPRIKG
jgi:hypothetical protein